MTQSNFTIVRATEKDIPLLLFLIRELARYERMSQAVEATEDKLRLCLFGERPYAEAVLGYCGDAPAGFALFFHSVSTFLGLPGLYLEDLYVVSEYRGRGLGRALLAHLARLAVERGCGRLEWSVLDWNEPAIGFYKKLGAVPMDEWTVDRMTGESLRRLAGR
jgi:GNAT superfamily N-acetyltransferase